MEIDLDTIQERLLENASALRCLSQNTPLPQRFTVISRTISGNISAFLDDRLLGKLEANLDLEREVIRKGSWRGKPWLKYGKYSLQQDPTDNALLKNREKSAVIASLPFHELRKEIKGLISHFGGISALDKAINDLHLVQKLASTQLSNHGKVTSPTLSESDISLCLAWANCARPLNFVHTGLSLLKQHLTPYDAARLLSARAAELAVQEYYFGLGQSVTDIAITQLSKDDSRWKAFDLLVDDLPIDVKNARRSFSSPESYVEHCVPRFKINRQTGIEVSIAGVLSPYISNPEEILAGGGACLVLGIVNVSEIRCLYEWMRDRFRDCLNLSGIWNPGYLPGWIFEYPPAQYVSRDEMAVKITNLIDCFLALRMVSPELIPPSYLSLYRNAGLLKKLRLPPRDHRILSDLHALQATVGLKRSSLYVYSMGLLIEAICTGDNVEDVANSLGRFIFLPPVGSVLGLIDQQDYVRQIITMLVSIGQTAQARGLSFTAFQMPSPAILKGLRSDGVWMTLIAYCGGWLESPKIKCGTSPLIFGAHDTCESCGRLVCDKCGFCSDSCSSYEERRRRIGTAAPPSAMDDIVDSI